MSTRPKRIVTQTLHKIHGGLRRNATGIGMTPRIFFFFIYYFFCVSSLLFFVCFIKDEKVSAITMREGLWLLTGHYFFCSVNVYVDEIAGCAELVVKLSNRKLFTG